MTVKYVQGSIFQEDDMRYARKSGKTRKDFVNYEKFTEKFEQPKTTDDCFTPKKVYDVVLGFVGKLIDMADRPIVRPFCPGGDYENYDYPDNCIVVDNPPFSIFSRIVRFYLDHRINFFLFGPHLTIFVSNADCCYILTSAQIRYENNAKVNTSFVTNLVRDYSIWCCPDLKEEIEKAQLIEKPTLQKYDYPFDVVSSATLGKLINRGIEFKVLRDQCIYISNMDKLREKGKVLFGGGFLLSRRAAAERAAAERAAAERASAERASAERAAAEKENVFIIELSERERIIQEKLSNNKIQQYGKI